MYTPQRRVSPAKGFTVLELVVVLIVLGLLAVIAVPKYLAMQTQAAARALQGATAALSSQVYVDYAHAVLMRPSLAYAWTGESDAASLVVGDFVGSYTVESGTVTVTVTGGANDKGSSVFDDASGLAQSSDYAQQTFQLYSPAP